MAARKKKEDLQGSLFAAAAPLPRALPVEADDQAPDLAAARPAPESSTRLVPEEASVAAPVTSPASEQEHLATNYRLNWWVRERPNGVRVVPMVDGQFLIERVRDNGTTFSAWFATRDELEQLVARGAEALK